MTPQTVCIESRRAVIGVLAFDPLIWEELATESGDFSGIQKSSWRMQNVFFGIQKFVLDIFGCQRGLMNCKIVLDILESQKRQGWGSTVGEPKRSRKSSRKQKAHITGKATQTTGAGK